MKTVTILMSTYNGEKYLSEQIDSLLAQVGVLVEILIRDDGSTDNTLVILNDYCRKYSNINYYQGKNIGPGNSFLDLIKVSGDTEYYAFCDQDDVWDNNKLQKAIKYLEKTDITKPAMYYSNLRVVDENLKFYRMSHNQPQIPKNKYTALIDNLSTGCTIVFNKNARNLLKDCPEINCHKHDAWLFLVCSILGETVYDEKGYIAYRQHSNNVIGTYLKRKTISDYMNRIKEIFVLRENSRLENAKNMLKCFAPYLNSYDYDKVNKFAHYNDNLISKTKLIFDKEICASTKNLNFRYKLFALFGKL